MLQQNIWHIAKYQDNKIIRNLFKRPNTANVHFHFPLRKLQPQTCGLIYEFHEEMHGHLKRFRAGVLNLLWFTDP